MYWKIIGARRDTGEDVVIVVAADDEAAARHAARRRGVLVAELRPVRIRKAKPVAAAPAAPGNERGAGAVPEPTIAPPQVSPFADAAPIATSVVTPIAPADVGAADPTPAQATGIHTPTAVDEKSIEDSERADVTAAAGAPGGNPPSVTEPDAAEAEQDKPEEKPRDAPEAAPPEGVLAEGVSAEGAPPAASADAAAAHAPTSGPGPASRAPRRVQVRRAAGAPLPAHFAEMLSVPQSPPRTSSRRPPNPRPITGYPKPGPVRRPDHRTAGRTGRAPVLARGVALGLALGAAAAGIVALRLLAGDSTPRPLVAGTAAAERGTTGPEHSLVDPGATYVPAAHSIQSERVRQQDDNATLPRDAELPRARHGPIEVVLVSAALQRAAGPSRLTARLVVAVRVRNASPTATLLYRPWSGGDAAPYALPVRLHDDEGRDYPLRGIDFGREAPGLGAELRPGDAATDVLAFQLPGETFASLDLELPPENVGGKGPFPLRLHIPAAAVCR